MVELSAFIKLANTYQIIAFLLGFPELNSTAVFSVAGDHNDHQFAYEGIRTPLVLESEKMTKRSRIAIATACSAATLSVLMAPAAFAANTAQTHGATATTASTASSAKPTMHKAAKHTTTHAKTSHTAPHAATPAAATPKK